MIGNNILRYIKENGPSQLILSKKSGVPYKRLNDVLNERGRITVEEYLSVCDALNVPLNTFRSEKEV